MKLDCDELCECDKLTNNLSPILDPLTIMVNMISNDDSDIKDVDKDILMNNDIINSSNLKSIGIILFRHQHILIILTVIIILMIFRIFYIQSRYFI